MAKMYAFGEFETSPKTPMSACAVTKQFAMFREATNARAELGFNIES